MSRRSASQQLSSSSETASESGSRLNRRRVLATTAGATSLSLAGCLSSYETIGSSDDEEPITIGVLAPQPKSDYVGRSMERAAALAVDELNEDGGLLGRDVELVVGDTNGSPLEAKREYQRLVLEENADVTTGVFDSLALRNIMDDIAEQETIHLTSGAATTAASQLVAEDYERYKYHFRVGPTNDRHLGQAQVDFVDAVADDVGWESVALLAEDYEWSREPWDVITETLEETGVDIAMDERYPPATNDFSEIYESVADAGADMALIAAAHTGNDALLDWSYPNKPEVPPQPQPFAFGGIHVPLQMPGYYDQTDGACEYAIGVISATADSEFPGGTGAFVDAYQKKHDGATPVYTGYHTYDAVTVFADVVADRETLETDELISALEAVTFDGVIGTVEFYDETNPYPHDLVYVEEETLFFQWQETDDGEGVQEIIWPEEHATTNAHGEYVTPEWL